MALIRAQKTDAQLARLSWFLGRVITPNAERSRGVLAASGFENYYPKQRVMRPAPKNRMSAAQRNSGIALYRSINRPLWQGYLLVRFDMQGAGRYWRDVLRDAGVCGLLGNAEAQFPYPFPNAAVAALKSLEVKSGDDDEPAIPITVTVRDIAVRLRDMVECVEARGEAPEPSLGYSIGEQVRLSDAGAFTGLDGQITELPDVPLAKLDESDRVKLLVAFFGGLVPVELPIGSIAKLSGGL